MMARRSVTVNKSTFCRLAGQTERSDLLHFVQRAYTPEKVVWVRPGGDGDDIPTRAWRDRNSQNGRKTREGPEGVFPNDGREN